MRTWAETESEPVVRDFDSFYRAEYRSVVALAAVLSGSRSAAEDLVPRGPCEVPQTDGARP